MDFIDATDKKMIQRVSRNLPKFRKKLLSEADRHFTEISRNIPKLTEISQNRFPVSVQTLLLVRIRANVLGTVWESLDSPRIPVSRLQVAYL